MTKNILLGEPISHITPSERIKLLSSLQKRGDHTVTPDEIPEDLFSLKSLETVDYDYLDNSSIKQLENRKNELEKMQTDLLEKISLIEYFNK